MPIPSISSDSSDSRCANYWKAGGHKAESKKIRNNQQQQQQQQQSAAADEEKAKTRKDIVTDSKTGMPDAPLKLTGEEIPQTQTELELAAAAFEKARFFLAVLAGLVLTAMLLKWCQ